MNKQYRHTIPLSLRKFNILMLIIKKVYILFYLSLINDLKENKPY